MKGLLHRPLAVCSALFLLILFITLRCGSALALPLCVGCLLGALLLLCGAIWFVPRGRALRRGLFYTAGLLLAASLATGTAARVTAGTPDLLDSDSKVFEAVFTVDKVEYTTAYSTTVTGTLHSIDGKTAEADGRVYLPYGASLAPGDRIALRMTLTPLSPSAGSLAESYDYAQGILFEAEAEEQGHRLLARKEQFPESHLTAVRLALRRQFYPYLSDGDTGLLSALLIGDKSGLDADLKDQFRHLGISHTLAVSGLHLSILCGSLLWILKKLGTPRRARLPIVALPLLFYMLLVGSPSVLRAGGMLLIFLCAYHFGRRPDPLTSLTATVALICLLSPTSVLDVGLLLSFFATLGILLLLPAYTEKLKTLPAIPRSLLSALTVTGAATLFTLPFSVWYFGEWAILSPLANLLLVPLVTLLLYLAPILLILSPIGPLAAAPALLIRGLCHLLRLCGSFFGGSDYLLLPLGYPVIYGLAICGIVAAALLCFFSKTRPWTLGIALVFLLCAGGYCGHHAYSLAARSAVYVWQEDGENQLLTLRAGTRVMLADHTGGSYADWREAVENAEADPLLRVDTILLTHYRYRQISALTRLLAERRIEYLLLPMPAKEEQNTAYILAERAKSAGCRVQWYSKDSPCIGYHDAELRFSFVDWDNYVPRRITVTAGGRRQTFALSVKGAPSAE